MNLPPYHHGKRLSYTNPTKELNTLKERENFYCIVTVMWKNVFRTPNGERVIKLVFLAKQICFVNPKDPNFKNIE